MGAGYWLQATWPVLANLSALFKHYSTLKFVFDIWSSAPAVADNTTFIGSIVMLILFAISCLLLMLNKQTVLLVWSNPNQSNRRSAVQWNFPLWWAFSASKHVFTVCNALDEENALPASFRFDTQQGENENACLIAIMQLQPHFQVRGQFNPPALTPLSLQTGWTIRTHLSPTGFTNFNFFGWKICCALAKI